MGRMTEEMMIISVCREMGWTYWEYLIQPAWFLDMIIDQMRIDSESIKRTASKIRHK